MAEEAKFRAMTALLILAPELPLLFQGQETGSRRRWNFFVDHAPELQDPIRRGRAAFVAQFPRLATPEAQAALLDPCAESTFTACILDPAERSFANPSVQLHRDLLRLRREDPAFAGEVDGAVLSDRVLALRFFQDHPAHDRLLLVNLGGTFARAVVPEPLIAPPRGTGWRHAWSSEDPRYGGHGTPPVFTRARLAIPAHAAVLLAPDAAASLRQDDPPPPPGDQLPVEP
jgi:maltooligosyltrehalose trehalohydrolase